LYGAHIFSGEGSLEGSLVIYVISYLFLGVSIEMLYSQIEASDITIGAPTKSEFGIKCFIALKGRKEFIFQTPTLPLAWDVAPKVFNGKPTCTLSMVLKGGATAAQFKSWLEQIEEQLEESIAADGVKMFGVTIAKEACPVIVKVPANPKYSATFNASVDVEPDHTVSLAAFDKDRRQIDASYLTKGTPCAALVKMTHLFYSFATKKVTVRLEATQCLCGGQEVVQQVCAFV